MLLAFLDSLVLCFIAFAKCAFCQKIAMHSIWLFHQTQKKMIAYYEELRNSEEKSNISLEHLATIIFPLHGLILISSQQQTKRLIEKIHSPYLSFVLLSKIYIWIQ